MAVARQAFLEQGVEQRQQQRSIAAGAHEQVLVGDGRGFAAPRIDHHQFAATRLDGFEALFHIRHGHDAAVGGQRVAAEDQHEIGVIDIGNRDQQAVAVHQEAGQVVRQLVDRGSGEAIAGFQLTEEIVAVGHQPVVVHAGIALIHGHGVLPMRGLDRTQALGHQVEGLVPADGLPLLANSAHGLTNSIRVVLDVLQCHGLGADMATAETVLGIALDRANLRAAVSLSFGFDGESTDGFAQMARTVMKGLGHGLASCSDPRRPVRSQVMNYGPSAETTPAAFVS